MKFPSTKQLIFAGSIIGTVAGCTVISKDVVGGEKVKSNARLLGKTAVVTGANSGIGKEVALELATRGGRIIMACRDLDKCEKVREEIIEKSYNRNVHCRKLDLSSFDSVREFAEDIDKNEKTLNLLINNAGVMGLKEKEVTAEGIEKHLGVNYLGHFLLTALLLDKLKNNAPSRIINTGSVTATVRELKFKDLNCDKCYTWKDAYEQSKVANLFFTKELIKRLEGTGVKPFCVLPGLTKTEIGRHLSINRSYISSVLLSPILWIVQKTPVQGAQGTIYCAVEPSLLEKDSGNYFSQLKEMKKLEGSLDASISKRLWLTSEKWTRLVD